MTQVLLAEDGAMISMALEDTLQDHGYTIAGPFPTCSTAITWLQDNTPDLAVLDLILSDGPCIELARALRHRNVPILFLSGYSHHSLPADLQDVEWLEKPFPSDRLMVALRSLQEYSQRQKHR
jgi:DNA-binding response OmpR family regulator